MAKKILIFILALMFITLIAVGYKALKTKDARDLPQGDNSADIRETGTKTYGFFIQNSPDENTAGKSSAIILISLDNDYREIKTVAIYSDTLMNTNDFIQIGSAYEQSDARYTVDMIEKNLDININSYMFASIPVIVDTINALGGIEADITDKEAELANERIREINSSYSSNSATIAAGKWTLDGVQATGYIMSRCADGGETQKSLLGSIAEKYKVTGETTRDKIIKNLRKNCDTKMTEDEIAFMANCIASYSIAGSDNYPKYKEKTSVGKLGNCTIANDAATNAVWIHEFLYEVNNYQPPEGFNDLNEAVVNTD